MHFHSCLHYVWKCQKIWQEKKKSEIASKIGPVGEGNTTIFFRPYDLAVKDLKHYGSKLDSNGFSLFALVELLICEKRTKEPKLKNC